VQKVIPEAGGAIVGAAASKYVLPEPPAKLAVAVGGAGPAGVGAGDIIRAGATGRVQQGEAGGESSSGVAGSMERHFGL
jgi:hypothetical protein